MQELVQVLAMVHLGMVPLAPELAPEPPEPAPEPPELAPLILAPMVRSQHVCYAC